MPYEEEVRELARCASRHHGELKEVVFLRKNKDCLLVYADGTVIAPDDDGSLGREYGAYDGYREIAEQLGGTHPFSLLAFGYQGTGPGCFAAFLDAAGFEVSETEMEEISPPVRLLADGSRVTGTGSGDSVEWQDQSQTPTATVA